MDRKPRCRMLDRKLNRCANEAVTPFGLCAADLAAAYAEFNAVTADPPKPLERAAPPPRREAARLAG
jgi:hypothetical protein